MNLGTTRLRGRPRNRWQNEVKEDGRIVGGEGWRDKVWNREEWKKLLRTARNSRILHMPMEWMNEYLMLFISTLSVILVLYIKNPQPFRNGFCLPLGFPRTVLYVFFCLPCECACLTWGTWQINLYLCNELFCVGCNDAECFGKGAQRTEDAPAWTGNGFYSYWTQ